MSGLKKYPVLIWSIFSVNHDRGQNRVEVYLITWSFLFLQYSSRRSTNSWQPCLSLRPANQRRKRRTRRKKRRRSTKRKPSLDWTRSSRHLPLSQRRRARTRTTRILCPRRPRSQGEPQSFILLNEISSYFF